MRRSTVIGVAVASVVAAAAIARSALQAPPILTLEEKALREYAGVYQWEADAYVYLQLWNELAGTNQLVAFDESGDVRTLYPTDRDRFFSGPGAAVSSSIESRVEFHRDGAGRITSLTWRREGAAPRTAPRIEIEKHEDVRFSNGAIVLTGTLITPRGGTRHPAIVLVHGSGPANREAMLPFARFLVRHGIALLGYDKRGVGGSRGDWTTASFDDLAADAVAAFEYLKTRSDIDAAKIGLLGVSQAGWIMPLAAVRAKDFAFLISVSGAGIPGAETTVDHAYNEMTARGMRPQVVSEIIAVMKLQNEFARTGQGWADYAARRETLVSRLGAPPANFPGTPDDRYFEFMRRLYFYDPAPTLRQLRVPTLALFGELDNNIMAVKNKAAWDAALDAAGNRDYTSRIVPRANHIHLEAKVGTNAEMASLQRFAPEYVTTVRDWVTQRVTLRGGSDD